jgi:uncharacterized protein YndB with AHSA1/START domain
MLLLLLATAPATAQHAKRAAKGEDTGPVTVMRSATLKVTIASDAVGIFDYLSDSKKLVLWFPDQAIIEPQLGGKYHFRWTGTQGVWSGVVTEFIRGNTLGFTWQPPDEPVQTNVRIKLFPQGAETVVELSHSGFPSSEALDKAVTTWVFYLQNLKSVIEQGADMRGQMRRKTTHPTSARPRRTG